ncbi:hypothetical protein SB659_01645 [Arthrobacter sp. SIMBA_036]|uniref:hypothetical protein n=1 Tax=Arthrobacter sp. SIMBA_036 TaxID=3085778 RepID=UPI00397C2992
MRWDSLFADLESQMWADRALAIEAEITDRARVEAAGIELADRLRGAVLSEVTVALNDGGVIAGRLGHVGSGWLVLTEGTRQWLVPTTAVSSYRGLGRLARKPQARFVQPLGIGSALRVLAQNRTDLTIHLAVAGSAGQQIHGVIDRVGQDHFDVAAYPGGDARRSGRVISLATVPFGALSAISSRGNQQF